MMSCEGCGTGFEAARRDQRYCTGTCRARAARQRRAAGENALEKGKTGTSAEHDLVRAVRIELEKADALMSVQGQIALQLARRLVTPDASGLAAMADKLTAAVAAATGTKLESDDAGSAPDDDVKRARDARERKAREAAAGRA